MNLTLSHCIVTVNDQDAALAFYRDVLGLQVHTDLPIGGEDARWLTVVDPSQPGVEIVLDTPGMGRSPEDAAALAALITKGALPSVMFNTDDLDATFEKVRASGAEVLQEPIDQPYGVRDCAFRDPSGNMVRFSQELARANPGG